MPTNRFATPLLYVLFSLSGGCALIYEILWSKHLSLTFGTSIGAISTVAATFMAGLAIGSFLIGKVADRTKNLLILYAILEAGIALSAGIFPFALESCTTLYIHLSESFPDSGLLATSIRMILSTLLLLPPTICMGGTLPIMCRLFARHNLSSFVGRLYAVNTFGAAVGCFSAGYVLIPSLGLSLTGTLAIVCNLLIATSAIVLAKFDLTGVIPQHQPTLKSDNFKPKKQLFLLACIALLGAIGLAYEILWTRVFLLFLGGTTYAFSLILSVYLIGLTLGGAIYARWLHKRPNRSRQFLWLSLLMGLSILITAPFYDHLAYVFQDANQISSDNWWLLSLLSLLIVFIVTIVPTTISGALLPTAVSLLKPGRTHAGEGVGLVVLCNTLGAMLGSLAAGFLLVPVFGILNSFRLLAVLNLFLALGYVLKTRPAATRIAITSFSILTLLCLGLFLTPQNWDQKLMTSGVYLYAPYYKEVGGLHRALGTTRLLYAGEGIETTVAVKQTRKRERALIVNGKTDASTGSDMKTQLLLSNLPLLLHPAPHNLLVIGLGSGITLGGALPYDLEIIDCIEISPEVVKASRFFANENFSALNDSRVHLFIQDGRNFLLTRSKLYDIIVSEPSNPWQAGNANLFTDEFYTIAAERLADGGIFCQWLPIYDLPQESLLTALGTFRKTFPHSLVFATQGGDLIITGSKSPLSLHLSELQKRFKSPGVRSRFASAGISSVTDLILRHYRFDGQILASLTETAPLNRDDLPLLEFSGRFLLGRSSADPFARTNLKLLNDAQINHPPNKWPLIWDGISSTERRRIESFIAEAHSFIEN